QAFRLRDFFAVYDPAVFRRVAGYAEVALVEALDTLARYEAAGAWGRWLRTWRAITTLPLSPDLLAAAITQFEAARQSLPRRAPRLARSARLTDLARRLQLYAVALCERAAASGPGAAGAWQSTALPPGALAAYLPLLRDLAAAPDPLPGG
ncbi:MAG TPA: hypothetical protein VKY74_26235, partial [Chloroflexia bacterium]|nr:hypothetical protein [Chloroflexia bacterium]